MKREVRVILHNIRSSHNVGAILRTADGAGVAKAYLTGYTPLPVNAFGKINADIAKTALGAEQSVSWVHRRSLKALLTMLHKEQVVVVGVEQAAGACPIEKHRMPKKVAYVFGNEVDGLSNKEVALCDELVELPMRGKKESLNVSAAAAIVLYRSLI